MPSLRPICHLPVRFLLVPLALLVAGTFPCEAQHTVTQDAGGGRKIELHYNAAGQITETRTLGPDGKVLQKDVLDYSPGYYVPQATATSYWPDGTIHRYSKNTYDKNSNFTGEFIQVFDESGKQIAGHRLTHDPQTNVYHCADWNIAAQDYKTITCPAGEEASGPPETVKKFTPAEVAQQLAKAHESAQKPATTAPSRAPSGTGTNVREVGFILPARVRAGERVSGSVVEDPANYEGMPELMVTRVALPFAPSGAGSTLAGWTLEMSGETPQPANGSIGLTFPPGQVDLAIMFRQVGNEGAPVSKAISVPRTPRNKAKPSASYIAPPICLKGQLCVVHGAFSGDSRKTFAAFEDRAAKIVAETADSAYIAIPAKTDAGPRALAISEGSKNIVFPMVVGAVTVTPDQRDLKPDDPVVMTAGLYGAEEVPDLEWLPGNYPASNLDAARKLVPGFQVGAGGHEAKERREAQEKREAEQKRESKGKDASAKPDEDEDLGGEILLVIKNLTPDVANFRESDNGQYVFRLKAAAFKMGEFKYKFVVEGKKAGTFAVQASAIPFLAPVTAQVFPAEASAPAK